MVGIAEATDVKAVADLTYTLVLADHGKVLNCTAGCVVSCPPQPEGFSVAIRQAGASQASVTAIEGAEIVPGSELKTAQQYASISLLSTAWGTFSIYGQTAA
jgi:hypothetical protein